MLGKKSLDCLLYASMPFSGDRKAFYKMLCDKYSEKAVLTKLDKLDDKGYLDYGVHVRGSWLTDKGKEKLKECLERQDNNKTNPSPT